MLVDFELIKRAQKGDSAAFNEVVLAYRKRILGTITRLIARPEDVEDVAQEVFLRLFFSLDQLRTAEVFEPWLHRLTVNAAYDYLRKQRRRQEYRMSDLSEQQVMMADAVAGGKVDHDEQQQKKIRESVDSLLGAVSEADRILLMMKEVEGLSLKELEKVYNVNENALKVRLFRARQRVLKAFGAWKSKEKPTSNGVGSRVICIQCERATTRNSMLSSGRMRVRARRRSRAPISCPNLWQRIESRQSYHVLFPTNGQRFRNGCSSAFDRVGRLHVGPELQPELLHPEIP